MLILLFFYLEIFSYELINSHYMFCSIHKFRSSFSVNYIVSFFVYLIYLFFLIMNFYLFFVQILGLIEKATFTLYLFFRFNFRNTNTCFNLHLIKGLFINGYLSIHIMQSSIRRCIFLFCFLPSFS